MSSIPLQVCSRCKIEQPISSFYKNASKKGGHNTECRTCYLRYRPQVIRRNRERVEQIGVYLNKIKRSQGCAVCQEREPVCLDFHHLDPSLKVAEVSRFQNERKTWAGLDEEIAKCILLCANCHRKYHAGHFQGDPRLLRAAANYLERDGKL